MNTKQLEKYFKNIFYGLLICMPLSLFANSPVKSIDSAGNITYSEKPLAGAQVITKVPIQAGPSTSEINAAQQQAKENIEQADKIDLNPKPAAKKQSTKPTAPEVDKQVINAGSANRPYVTKPKPRPPINRPGINPPAKRPVARPQAGGRR